MSTAVAPAPAAGPLTSHMSRDPSPKQSMLSRPSPPPRQQINTSSTSNSTPPKPSTVQQQQQDGPPAKSNNNLEGKKGASPNQNQSNGNVPKVLVKKEPPSSPAMPTRHRPRKLDLSASLPNAEGLSARPPGGPMTAREGVSMQDVGFACLSPGFQTYDPVLREQLQRSLSVRDQQRSIIESRLHRNPKDDVPNGTRPSDSTLFGPAKSSKRRPPGLSIVPPSASQFANERVIQSAPLNHTFTGRNQILPLSRQPGNVSPNLDSASRIHHVPATQTNNRLPPLSDVFGSDALGSRNRDRDAPPRSNGFYPAAPTPTSSQPNNVRPLPSPGLPPQNVSHAPERSREYRSAEEAVHEMSGGREDLLPRIVRYNGRQPVTSPSSHAPMNAPQHATDSAPPTGAPPAGVQIRRPSLLHPTEGGTARRRPRSEYEMDNGSPPLGHGPEPRHRPNPAESMLHEAFSAGRDPPETQRRKKEEFLSLCSRAWDLFHS